MKKKVFLIEDSKDEFKLLRTELIADYNIIPKNWNDLYRSGIEAYLNDQSDENKKVVEKYLQKMKFDAVILDLKLFIDYGGQRLFKCIFSEKSFMNIPVIFITKEYLQSETDVTGRSQYVQKRFDSHGFDVKETVKQINMAMKSIRRDIAIKKSISEMM